MSASEQFRHYIGLHDGLSLNLCALVGGPLDGKTRQWGAIRVAHGLNGLVMREEHVLDIIEFIEAPKRQLAHPVGDLLQRFAENVPGGVLNLRLNLVSSVGLECCHQQFSAYRPRRTVSLEFI